MGRKKVKLAFIENNSQRKATFNQRKGGIIKKLNEITTLCDVKACAIIYSPFDQNPVVWPSEEEARRVTVDFKALPEMDRNKKMVDQQAHLKQRIAKNKEGANKLKRETKELEMDQVLSQSFMGNWMTHTMSISDLNNLGYKIDQNFQIVMRNIQIQHESGMEMGESSNAAAPASEGIASTIAPIAPNHEVGGSSSSSAAFYRPSQQQPEFQYPPLALHVGQPQNLNLTLHHNLNQNEWLMDYIMNHPAQLSNAAEQAQPHQPTTGDSTVSAAPSPSNDVPAKNPNPTNNI